MRQQYTNSVESGQPQPTSDEVLQVFRQAVKYGLISPSARSSLAALEAQQAGGALTHDEALTALRDALLGAGIARRAVDTVKQLYEPGDVIEFRAVYDGGAVSLCGDLHNDAQRTAMIALVENHLGHSSLYFGVCPRKPEFAGTNKSGAAKDVLCRRHIALDLDNKDAPDVDPDWTRTLDALKALGPAMVLNTGNGWHLWFRVEDQDNPETGQPAFTRALGIIGSDAVADLSRVMRLPFTLNIPNAGKRERGAVLRLACPLQQANTQPESEAA